MKIQVFCTVTGTMEVYIMNNTSKSSLSGSKTEQNLKDAASNEALAHVRYTLFSDIAKESGQLEAARLFENHASHEKEHAELWLSYLDELSDTDDNLDRALKGEIYESTEYYPSFSKTASDEGFYEISDKFRMAGDVEKHHAKNLERLAEELAKGEHTSDDAECVWCCTNCGYHTKGNMPPERCPLCGYPKWYFTKE